MNIFCGTHISSGCELHISDFTHPRTWPFDRKIEVAFLDQKDKDNKWSTSFSFYSNKDEHEDAPPQATTRFLDDYEKTSLLKHNS